MTVFSLLPIQKPRFYSQNENPYAFGEGIDTEEYPEDYSDSRDVITLKNRFQKGIAFDKLSPLFQEAIREVVSWYIYGGIPKGDAGDKMMEAFVNWLEKASSLKVLDLYKTARVADYLFQLSQAFPKEAPLEELYLDEIPIATVEPGLAAERLTNLGSWLNTLSNLQVLSLKGVGLGIEGAKMLGAYLEKNTRVKYLHLASNNLQDNGLIAMEAGLKKQTHLEWLSLDKNQLSGKGAEALARSLSQLRRLKHLFFSDNFFGDPGITYVAQGLNMRFKAEPLAPLKTLVFKNNKIGVAGAQNLFAILYRELEKNASDASEEKKEQPEDVKTLDLKRLSLEKNLVNPREMRFPVKNPQTGEKKYLQLSDFQSVWGHKVEL